eukprot:TRINITY_DN32042_c0_g1_i1.p1 TRINITY_DN32042_c0_g1~~TRINITY_DN32042_c0_g1_i1.p1  ORF type:complete len:420 (-),score=134.14 TRINITY_DN32042_c0_g1_i1:180-1439(-)
MFSKAVSGASARVQLAASRRFVAAGKPSRKSAQAIGFGDVPPAAVAESPSPTALQRVMAAATARAQNVASALSGGFQKMTHMENHQSQQVFIPELMPSTYFGSPKEEPPRPEAPKQLKELKLGFIGFGAMAQAVSFGLVGKNLADPSMVMATDAMSVVLEKAQKEGIATSMCNKELVEWADVVVMAVKPQVVDSVMAQIGPIWKEEKVLVSICAGVTIDTYLAGLGRDAKVVRVMPNTPCLIGEAATAYAGSATCGEWELGIVRDMFEAVGEAHKVPESLLNAVTGLSGSGPAYVYMMVQALSDAGVHGGLPRDVATSLAVQTVIGSAKMVQESGKHPAVLKEAVTSPAGTTIAGVRTLEKMGFNAAVIEAVDAARIAGEDPDQSAVEGVQALDRMGFNKAVFSAVDSAKTRAEELGAK